LKTLGILGGLGPASSNYFMERFTALRGAKSDQEHPDVLLFSRASTPDRTAYLLGSSESSPLPALLDSIYRLEDAGAEVMAMPCVTAHHFYRPLADASHGKLINMLEETAAVLQRQGVQTVGLLATSGTIQSGTFVGVLENAGMKVFVLDTDQQSRLMDFIYAVKAGKLLRTSALERFGTQLLSQGAQRVILGCTELSLFRSKLENKPYFDPVEALAARCLELCTGAPVHIPGVVRGS
jgi:aspartate racemase